MQIMRRVFIPEPVPQTLTAPSWSQRRVSMMEWTLTAGGPAGAVELLQRTMTSLTTHTLLTCECCSGMFSVHVVISKTFNASHPSCQWGGPKAGRVLGVYRVGWSCPDYGRAEPESEAGPVFGVLSLPMFRSWLLDNFSSNKAAGSLQPLHTQTETEL